MAANLSWDAIVFGEIVFPQGGVLAWAAEWHQRVAQLEGLDSLSDDQLAQVLITPVGVAVRCWLSSASFQEWCPRIEAMFAAAARLGARGDVTFVAVDGPAYLLSVEAGRATLSRVVSPGVEHPLVQEILVALERKTARRGLVRTEVPEEDTAVERKGAA
jgi:hypothetical protein